MTALYTAGLVARCDQRPIDVIESLAEAMAGRVAFVGNQLLMRAGSYTAPVLSLGDDSMVGPPELVQSGTPRQDLFNVVNAKIIDDEQAWKPDVDMPQVSAAEYIWNDNGEELPIDLQFEAIHSAAQAQQVAAVMLRYARQAMTITAKFNMKAYRVQVFDIIALTCAGLGIADKSFIVLNRKWSLGMAIELTLREISQSIYEFGNRFEAIDPAPNTTLPLPTEVAQLTGLAVGTEPSLQADGSVVTRTVVSWTPSTDLAVTQTGRVEVQFYDTLRGIPPEIDWPSQFEQGSASSTTIVGLRGGATYVFRARFVNGSGVRGMWGQRVVADIGNRAVMLGSAALGSDHVIDNNAFTLATVDVAPKVGTAFVFAQIKLKNDSTGSLWQQLTFQITDGGGNTLAQIIKTWAREASKPTEYDVIALTYLDTDVSATAQGFARYQLECFGGATTHVTALAGDTFLTVQG